MVNTFKLFARDRWVNEEGTNAARVDVAGIDHHCLSASEGKNCLANIGECRDFDIAIREISLKLGVANGCLATGGQTISRSSDNEPVSVARFESGCPVAEFAFAGAQVDQPPG